MGIQRYMGAGDCSRQHFRSHFPELRLAPAAGTDRSASGPGHEVRAVERRGFQAANAQEDEPVPVVLASDGRIRRAFSGVVGREVELEWILRRKALASRKFARALDPDVECGGLPPRLTHEAREQAPALHGISRFGRLPRLLKDRTTFLFSGP